MTENWHKRHAIGLACQLPENASDANTIIRELQNLVDTWLHPAETQHRPRSLPCFATRNENNSPPVHGPRRVFSWTDHSTSRMTLRRFIRSSA